MFRKFFGRKPPPPTKGSVNTTSVTSVDTKKAEGSYTSPGLENYIKDYPEVIKDHSEEDNWGVKGEAPSSTTPLATETPSPSAEETPLLSAEVP